MIVKDMLKKKISTILIFGFFLFSFFSFFIFSSYFLNPVSAQPSSQVTIINLSDYQAMGGNVAAEVFSGVGSGDAAGEKAGANFSNYLKMVINLSLGFGVLLAVILLVVGGVQYVTVDTFTSKQAGKAGIQKALGGLLLLFISFLILHIINPKLIDGQALKIEDFSSDPVIFESSQNSALDRWIANRPGWDIGGRGYSKRVKVGDEYEIHATIGPIGNSIGCHADAQTFNRLPRLGDDEKSTVGNMYAKCVSCPKDIGGLTQECEIVVKDDSASTPTSASVNKINDQVFLVTCTARTVTAGVFGVSATTCGDTLNLQSLNNTSQEQIDEAENKNENWEKKCSSLDGVYWAELKGRFSLSTTGSEEINRAIAIQCLNQDSEIRNNGNIIKLPCHFQERTVREKLNSNAVDFVSELIINPNNYNLKICSYYIKK